MISDPVLWIYTQNPLPWAFIRSRSRSLWRRCMVNKDDTDGIAAVAICKATADFLKTYGEVNETNSDHFQNYINKAIYFAIVGEIKKAPPTINVEYLEAKTEPMECNNDQAESAFKLLTEDEEQIIRMTFGIGQEKQSIKDTAKILKTTIPLVKSLRGRAIVKMRTFLRNREV